ncbi:amino acid adenylation domain-containing protein [Cellulosilyticum ruminicola]|uniref:amino acid adenylation domain-containing protein n=1 Tax=Cellulosilyticum ruminicola TaxID=425254 RepID=UPI0006D1D662|nr:amino acid adenylation domain-containing protein [Cellulosilyticum ruminicola]
MNKTNDESKELKENFKLLQTTFLQNDNALFFNVKHDINEEETYYNVVAVLVGILKKLNNNSDFNVLMYEDKKRICTNEIQKDSIKELGKLLKEKGQDAQETFEDISVVLTNGSLENISKVPYEIALSVQIYNGQIKIDFDLRGNKVSHRSFVILANYITASLEYAIARDFEEKIDECLYIGEEEQTKAIVAYNDSKCEFDDKINIVQRFYNNLNEDIKKRVALNYEGKKYTYKELDELSNSIAKKLKEDKINVGDTVGIFMDRSAEYIIAIFGILKVGATYLPMDTTYPLNRVKAIMEKSEAKGIIAFQNSELHKADINNKIYVYEELVSQPVAVYQTDYSAISSQNNAYMIFTSGSTGTPKGIAIRHMSVINLVEYMKGQMFTKAADRDLNVTVVAEFVFDVSVGQIFYTLLTGRTLHIVSKAAKKSMEEFTSLLNREKIDLSDITPVYFRFLVDYLEVHKKKVRLPRRIICVGEALPLVLVERFYKLEGTKDVVIVNGYGPTEACVYATYFELTSENVKRLDMMSIGKPLYNMQAYVLDEHLKLCPIGVEGELYLAGAGLAKGYVNEPEITKKAYIPNVFEKGAMMYKTGDLVKWDADGNINYIGRIDRQTKIRGFRIELGEIEKKIEKLDEVREAVVVVKEGDNGKF